MARLVNVEREIQLYTNDKQAGSGYIALVDMYIIFFQILVKSIIYVYYKIVRVFIFLA